MCGGFLKKRRAQRLGVYGCFIEKVIKMMYKTEHTETQPKQQTSQSPSKNDLLKTTMSERHSNYYGFVKTGFRNHCLPHVFVCFFDILASLNFEGDLNIDHVLKINK